MIEISRLHNVTGLPWICNNPECNGNGAIQFYRPRGIQDRRRVVCRFCKRKQKFLMNSSAQSSNRITHNNHTREQLLDQVANTANRLRKIHPNDLRFLFPIEGYNRMDAETKKTMEKRQYWKCYRLIQDAVKENKITRDLVIRSNARNNNCPIATINEGYVQTNPEQIVVNPNPGPIRIHGLIEIKFKLENGVPANFPTQQEISQYNIKINRGMRGWTEYRWETSELKYQLTNKSIIVSPAHHVFKESIEQVVEWKRTIPGQIYPELGWMLQRGFRIDANATIGPIELGIDWLTTDVSLHNLIVMMKGRRVAQFDRSPGRREIDLFLDDILLLMKLPEFVEQHESILNQHQTRLDGTDSRINQFDTHVQNVRNDLDELKEQLHGETVETNRKFDSVFQLFNELITSIKGTNQHEPNEIAEAPENMFM